LVSANDQLAPAPAGLDEAAIQPAAASYNTALGEFILKYEDLDAEERPAGHGKGASIGSARNVPPASRVLPTICVHICNVSAVVLESAHFSSGHGFAF
jgi:hypothetical protein